MATVIPPQGETFDINTPAAIEDACRFLKATVLAAVKLSSGGFLLSADESDAPLTLNERASKWAREANPGSAISIWGSAISLTLEDARGIAGWEETISSLPP